MSIYENWFSIAILSLWVITVAFAVWYEFYCERVHDRQRRRSKKRLEGSEWNKWKESVDNDTNNERK